MKHTIQTQIEAFKKKYTFTSTLEGQQWNDIHVLDALEFISEALSEAESRAEEKARKCGCKHVKPDYWCICWIEGYEMGQSEKGYKKVKEIITELERIAGFEPTKSKHIGLDKLIQALKQSPVLSKKDTKLDSNSSNSLKGIQSPDTQCSYVTTTEHRGNPCKPDTLANDMSESGV